MAFKLLSLVIFIVASIHESHLQVSKIGTCPKNIQSVADFKAADFKGVWYEIQRYPSVQIMGRCVSIKYTPTANTCQVRTTQIMPGMNTTVSESIHSHQKANGTWKYTMNLGLSKYKMYLKESLTCSLVVISTKFQPTLPSKFWTPTIRTMQ